MSTSRFKVFCDESWSGTSPEAPFPCFVFYGVLVEEPAEASIIQTLDSFKAQRGLYTAKGPMEIKWSDAADEAKSAAKTGFPNRLEAYLDCFFQLMRARQISFAYLFLSRKEYERVEPLFVSSHEGGKHAFFFMLYFQMLFHCFIKPQTKHNPTAILIDDRNMGAEGVQYDIATLREFLNRALYRQSAPKFQLPLTAAFRKQLERSIQLVDLADSKAQPLIQLSDLCAGCVRYLIENRLPPPPGEGQLGLFASPAPSLNVEDVSPQHSLAMYFYGRLRTIVGYSDIHLLKPSYHHRFFIFPFQFGDRGA
jgi:hypothetical protein